jgi:uncharacterized delta-60 repeat protein
MKIQTHFFMLLLMAALLNLPLTSAAQNGSLDSTFGNAGKVITDMSISDIGKAIVTQPDGKIILAGSAKTGANVDFAVLRFLPDGTPDSTFGNGGIVVTDIDGDDQLYGLVLQADGKILVAGSSLTSHFQLLRYLPDGTLDNSFGAGGITASNVAGYTSGICRALAIQNDGKIILAGGVNNVSNLDVAVLRFKTNGTPDSSFAVNGVRITNNGGTHEQGYAVALQTDGKIVVCGYSSVVNGNGHMIVLRYTTSGNLDSTFANVGFVTTVVGISESVYTMGIQTDGKIVVGGNLVVNVPFNGNHDFMLLRYNPDGSLDNTFGNAGIAIDHTDSSSLGFAMAIEPDGKILLGGRTDLGNASDFLLSCWLPDGTLDTSFGNAGYTQTTITAKDFANCLTIQSDGKILMAGSGNDGSSVDFIMVRYLYGGVPESVPEVVAQPKQMICFPNPFSSKATLQVDAEVRNATISIFNCFGIKVLQIEHLWGVSHTIYGEGLPPGCYLALLTQQNKLIAQGKIVILN